MPLACRKNGPRIGQHRKGGWKAKRYSSSQPDPSPKPEPISEPDPLPEPEPSLEPDPSPKSEPSLKPEPSPKPEPTPKPVPTSEPETCTNMPSKSKQPWRKKGPHLGRRPKHWHSKRNNHTHNLPGVNQDGICLRQDDASINQDGIHVSQGGASINEGSSLTTNLADLKPGHDQLCLTGSDSKHKTLGDDCKHHTMLDSTCSDSNVRQVTLAPPGDTNIQQLLHVMTNSNVYQEENTVDGDVDRNISDANLDISTDVKQEAIDNDTWYAASYENINPICYVSEYDSLKTQLGASVHQIGDETGFLMLPTTVLIQFVLLYETLVPTVKMSVIIHRDYTAAVMVHRQHLGCTHPVWTSLPTTFTSTTDVSILLSALSSYPVCIGNPDADFMAVFSQSTVAYLEPDYGAVTSGMTYCQTIRATSCSLLDKSLRCKACQKYRCALRKTKSLNKAKQMQDKLNTEEVTQQLNDHGRQISSVKTKIEKNMEEYTTPQETWLGEMQQNERRQEERKQDGEQRVSICRDNLMEGNVSDDHIEALTEGDSSSHVRKVGDVSESRIEALTEGDSSSHIRKVGDDHIQALTEDNLGLHVKKVGDVSDGCLETLTEDDSSSHVRKVGDVSDGRLETLTEGDSSSRIRKVGDVSDGRLETLTEDDSSSHVRKVCVYSNGPSGTKVGVKNRSYRKKCSKCGDVFTDKALFIEHKCQHRKDICHVCEYCSKQFNQSSNLKFHVLHAHKRHELPLPCNVCNKRFANQSALACHSTSHSDKRNYQCMYCARRFKQKGQLSRHERLHTGSTPYLCYHCGKACSGNTELQNHMRTHTGEKPYKCEVCKKGFSIPGNLKRHERLHTSVRPHHCNLCSCSFNTSYQLTLHQRNKHTAIKPCICHVCEKAFAESSKLKKHLVSHGIGSMNTNASHKSSQPAKTFQCCHCERTFDTNVKCQRHESIHTGVYKYMCSYCGRGFHTEQALIGHIRSHTGEKPYKCLQCDKHFSLKVNLQKHSKIHTGEKPFACQYCAKRFRQRDHVTLHEQRHTGLKPHKCSMCEKCFLERGTLRKHMQTHGINASWSIAH